MPIPGHGEAACRRCRFGREELRGGVKSSCGSPLHIGVSRPTRAENCAQVQGNSADYDLIPDRFTVELRILTDIPEVFIGRVGRVKTHEEVAILGKWNHIGLGRWQPRCQSENENEEFGWFHRTG